jgi:endonuclease YncB( thermonuclease family)
MKKKRVATTALLAVGVSISSTFTATAAITITKVYDGDTITLSTGEKVRLLQIDTPELSPTECYSNEARNALVSLLNTPGQLSLKTDPKLDKVDQYGRLLRFVFIGKTNINLKLVEIGAAAPYFYKGSKGRYSNKILKAAQNAKSKSIGMWRACPGTQLTPNDAVATLGTSEPVTGSTPSTGANCDPNYAGCIPRFASDLDCPDIQLLGLAPVRVIANDVHNLDRDGDGIGCDR